MVRLGIEVCAETAFGKVQRVYHFKDLLLAFVRRAVSIHGLYVYRCPYHQSSPEFLKSIKPGHARAVQFDGVKSPVYQCGQKLIDFAA